MNPKVGATAPSPAPVNVASARCHCEDSQSQVEIYFVLLLNRFISILDPRQFVAIRID